MVGAFVYDILRWIGAQNENTIVHISGAGADAGVGDGVIEVAFIVLIVLFALIRCCSFFVILWSLVLGLAVLITFFMVGHNVQRNEHVNDDDTRAWHVYLDSQCVAYITPMNCRMMNNIQTNRNWQFTVLVWVTRTRTHTHRETLTITAIVHNRARS